MREWLSWWSATLPRSRPRVRVPSRALKIQLNTGFFVALHTTKTSSGRFLVVLNDEVIRKMEVKKKFRKNFGKNVSFLC